MKTKFLTRFCNTAACALAVFLFSALPTRAQTSNVTYAYALNNGDQTISVSKINTATGAVSGVSYIEYPVDATPTAIAFAAIPTRNFVYVGDNNSNVTGLSADRVTGALTEIGTTDVPDTVVAMYVNAPNQSLYVITADGSVSSFLINTDGTLTSQGTATAGGNPVSMTVVQGATQSYAYVVNQGDQTISQFTICAPPLDCSPLGGLVPGAIFPATGETLQAVAATPTGGTLYVSDVTLNHLLAFQINPATGALTEPPATFPTGSGPTAIAIDLQGQFLYAANSNDNTVSPFTIGSGGALTAISAATVLKGARPVALTIDPNSQLLYVADQSTNLLETYGIAPAFQQITEPNGFLNFVASNTTRSQPVSFSLAPPAVLSIPNEYFYATNSNSNTISGAPLDPASGDVGTIVNTPSLVNLPGAIIPDFTGLHVFINNGTASGAQLTEFTVTPSTGALTNSIPAQGAVTLVAGGNSQALDPSGRFLYVATSGGNAVLLCPVNGGILTGTCSQAVAVTNPVGVAVDPAGQFLYVLGTDGDDDFLVNVYSITSFSGALTLAEGSPYATGNSATNNNGGNENIAVHPSGRFIAVVNGFSNPFTIFSADGFGNLVKLADQTVQGRPQSLLFDASGTHLYEIEGGSFFVNTFQFNPQTGALNSIGTETTALIPGDAAIDPSGQFFLQLQVADDANLTGSVIVYPIIAGTGALDAAASTTTLGFNTISIAAVAENVVAQFPSVTPIPNAAAFTPTPVNTPATPINITVNNFGTAPLLFTSITIAAGANPGDFSFGPATTCSTQAPVPAAGSCIISVVFTPTVVATRSATLTLIDNANPATQFVPLSGNGTGAGPAVTLAPTALAFPDTAQNAPSAPLSVLLTNSGGAPLIFSSIVINTGANPGDFTLGPATTCTTQTPVAAAGTCILSVIFTPGAAGPRSATLTLADNATPATQTLPLTGTGTAPTGPVVGLNPTAASFPNTALNTPSAPVAVTVTNSGQTTLTFTSITIGPFNSVPDFTLGPATTCTTDGGVSPNTSCILSIIFTPTAAGARTGTLTLTDNATPATQTIALSGNGTANGGGFTITIPEGPPIVIIAGQPTTIVTNVIPGPGGPVTITFNAPGPLPPGLCVFYPQPNPTTVTDPTSFTFRVTTTPNATPSAAPRPPTTFRPPSLPGPLQFPAALQLLALLLAILCASASLAGLVPPVAALVRAPRQAALALTSRFATRIPVRRLTAFAAISLLLAATITFAGCGNNSANNTPISLNTTPPGTYQIVITATAGTVSHSVTATIQVQ